MSLLVLVVGCVYVHRTVPWEDSGDSGLQDWPGDDGAACTSDAECPGPYACAGAVSTSTDGRGCVERCTADRDCKAGTTCLDDGACG